MSGHIGSLCSGYGGLEIAVQAVLGGRVAWHSEIDPAACKVLEARWPGVPNIGDMTAACWSTLTPVDVLCGGTPCQDVSHAGKRAGMRAGTRSGLWSSMVDAIDVLRPRLVVWENVRGVLSAEADSGMEPCALCVGDGAGPALRALGRVLGDLADLGYDARWCGLRAADVGAPHGRFRAFVTAHPANVGHERRGRAWGGWPGSAYDSELAADTEDNRRAGHPGISSSPGTVLIGTDIDRRAAADAERSGWDGWASDPQRGTLERTTATRRGAIPAADPDRAGRSEHGRPVAVRPQLAAIEHSGDLAADARSARLGGSHAAVSGATAADPDSYGLSGESWTPTGRDEIRPDERRDTDRRSMVDWGQYGPAVERWEHVTGRPAPAPTEPGRTGQRLSPRFVEWMMGLPAGWITDVPGTTRNDQLKMLGNGVVPQQAQAALEHMLGGAS